MKKYLFFLMLLITVSCSSQNEGERNACQFVRELMIDQAANIQSVEVVKVDSVMTPYVYMYNELKGDDHINAGFDIANSWLMDPENSDSLKQEPKYKKKWRKAYMVEVTMKSSKKLIYRVMMGDDGTTPQITSEEMRKEIKDFFKVP
jgi:hypothetical protein